MAPEITINVNLPPEDEAAVLESQSTSAGSGPAPMAFGQLQSAEGGSVEIAPAPMNTESLESVTVSTGGDTGEGPPPISVASLTATRQPEDPEPMALGALDHTVSAAGGAPVPMPIKELGSKPGNNKGGKKK